MDTVAVQFPKLGLNFSISREAFVIGDFEIYWYAVLIAVGAILAVIYGMTQARKYGINPDKLLDIVIVGLIFGIIGARLYYVVFNIQNYTSIADVFNIRDGGLAIYGALIFGILSAFIASRISKMRFLPALDIAAGGFFIGQAIGRWGNFVNQEAFGVNTDWIFGMYSEKTQEYLQSVSWELFKQGIDVDPAKPVHPCFLYESLWCIIGFLLVLLYRKHRKFDGELFLFYAAWYGSGRAFIEALRTDSLMIGDFRVSQLLSIAIAVSAVITIVTLRIRISKKRNTDPDYLKLYVDTAESRAQFMDDDKTILAKAEGLLNEASESINTAEKNLNRLLPDQDKVLDNTETLEDLASELSDPDAVLELIDKLINLSLTKISMATSLLDRYDELQQSDDNTSEETLEYQEQTDNLESDEPELSERIEIACEQIKSTKEYISECYEFLTAVKNRFLDPYQEENSNQEEQNTEETEQEIVSNSDVTGETQSPSPDENK